MIRIKSSGEIFYIIDTVCLQSKSYYKSKHMLNNLFLELFHDAEQN